MLLPLLLAGVGTVSAVVIPTLAERDDNASCMNPDTRPPYVVCVIGIKIYTSLSSQSNTI